MKKGRTIDNDKLILRMLITFLGTAGASSVVVPITRQYTGLEFVIVVSALFSALFTVLLSYNGKRKILVKTCGIAAVMALYCIVNFSWIFEGLKFIINLFIDYSSLGSGQDGAAAVSRVGANDIVISAMIFIIMMFSILAALEVNVFTNMLFALVIVLPVMSIFIAAVIIPPTLSIVMGMLFIFDSMALGKRGTYNNCYVMVIGSFVIAGIILIVMPRSGYDRIEFFENAREMVSDYVYDKFGIDLDGSSDESVNENAVNAAVGIGDGHIGQIDQLYYNDEEVGTYTTVSNGTSQYISIFKARDYEANNWTKWIDTREKQYYYTNSTFELAKSLTQRNTYDFTDDESALVKRFKYYSPTFVDKRGLHPALNNDIEYYIKDGGVMSYVNMGQLMEKYRNDDTFDSYESFVKQTYLTVRNEDREAVEKVFGKISVYDVTEKAEYINYVCEYLRKNYTYTMKPGKVPEGRNAVDYFLNESKRGYCTYFATAAAIALRCAGIPTRYCAGYVVDTSVDGTMTREDYYESYIVMDNSAHAWVEVFIDGYGWVTIDPTPGYGNDIEEENTQSSTEVTQSEAETDTGMQEINGSVGKTETDTDSSADNNLTGFSSSKGFGIGRINIEGKYVVAAAAGLITMLVAVVCMIRIFSRKSLLNPDKTDEKKLPEMYSYLEKLLVFSGFERALSEDYQDYIYRVIESESSLQGIGLENAMSIILAVRFGNAKCVDKADITGIIHTIRQVRSYALKKARGLRKLLVCLI